MVSPDHIVTLGGIGYQWSVQDRQVIFEERIPLFGCFTTFAFERNNDLNGTGGIWYLVHLESSSERVPANHISKALEWCKERFGDCFEPLKGELADYEH